MALDPIGDLETIYAAFAHTNVTGLSADPTITNKQDTKISLNNANGNIVVGTARLIDQRILNPSYNSQKILVEVEILWDHANIQQIRDELNRLHGVNNSATARKYTITMKDKFTGVTTRGKMELIVEMFVPSVASS